MTEQENPNPYRAYRRVVYGIYWIGVLLMAGLTTFGVIRGVYYPETQTAVENYELSNDPSPSTSD